MARGGIGLVAREIADEAFTLLDSLESHWGAGKPKPKFIWKILHEIGKHLSATLTTLQLETLRHASDLTCFAEFPLGLAVLPGDTAPLTCRFPIAYRPIVPLSRAFTSELNDVPIFYLRDRLNVLIVECLSQTDPIGRLSRVGWKQIEQTLKGAPGVRLKVVEATNASEIKAALAEDRWDILTISAHGGQHASENRTGFVCGEELIVEEELGRVPPIVWLSACQIAPRGRGTVNYSDMLFRSGAIAVIGTLVPIDVRHNAILMNRLFANLSETINGRETRFRTLQDMWHFTVTSNAFNDILFGNNSLREWAGDSRHAPSVIIEFMAQRSRGRLRPNHIYDDTIAVLGEIAQNRGVGQKFHSWIASQGFVPESAFYAVLGWPDRIVFHDQLIARLSREMEADK